MAVGWLPGAGVLLAALSIVYTDTHKMTECDENAVSVYTNEFHFTDLLHNTVHNMTEYEGKVVLITNVATY